MPGNVVLLGPQRPDPNAAAALAEISGSGPVVVLAAGWRQDEAEEELLEGIVGPQAEVLPLYRWFDAVMRDDPTLREAYRARQDALIRHQALNRIRLGGALQAVHQLLEEPESEVQLAQLELAQADVRRIDGDRVAACATAYADAGRPWDGAPLVQQLQAKAAEALQEARAIVLTGGHVAVLRNRIDFFGVGDVLRRQHAAGTPIVAWSAGAMVLTERVVLFYDDPPDGSPAYPEVLDQGLGLVPGLVVLPHARQRLRLDDPRRVSLLAQRFAPATCVGLENGAWLALHQGQWRNRGPAEAAVQLHPHGGVSPLMQETP